MSKKKVLMVPFDHEGNLQDVVWYSPSGMCTQEPNSVFEDRLTFDHLDHRGNLRFRNDAGKMVQAFASDADEFIKKMSFGVIEGTFTYRKQGMAYAITLVDQP